MLADGQTYPQWWKPVYIDVRRRRRVHAPALQGPAAVPPAHAHEDRPAPSARTGLEVETDGDLRGTGIWTLTPSESGGTHVRFDWRVHADRKLLRALTPVLRPALRWNHNWAIARAMDGLEPFVRRQKVAASSSRSSRPRARDLQR